MARSIRRRNPEPRFPMYTLRRTVFTRRTASQRRTVSRRRSAVPRTTVFPRRTPCRILPGPAPVGPATSRDLIIPLPLIAPIASVRAASPGPAGSAVQVGTTAPPGRHSGGVENARTGQHIQALLAQANNPPLWPFTPVPYLQQPTHGSDVVPGPPHSITIPSLPVSEETLEQSASFVARAQSGSGVEGLIKALIVLGHSLNKVSVIKREAVERLELERTPATLSQLAIGRIDTLFGLVRIKEITVVSMWCSEYNMPPLDFPFYIVEQQHVPEPSTGLYKEFDLFLGDSFRNFLRDRGFQLNLQNSGISVNPSLPATSSLSRQLSSRGRGNKTTPDSNPHTELLLTYPALASSLYAASTSNSAPRHSFDGRASTQVRRTNASSAKNQSRSAESVFSDWIGSSFSSISSLPYEISASSDLISPMLLKPLYRAGNLLQI